MYWCGGESMELGYVLNMRRDDQASSAQIGQVLIRSSGFRIRYANWEANTWSYVGEE